MAIDTSDRREALEALAERLAAEMDGPEITGRDVAALSRELRATLAELATLPRFEEASTVVSLRDRLAAKRAASGL